jgi:uncharacterized protein DUF4260
MSAARRALPNVAFIARRAAWFAGFLGLMAAAIATTGRFDLGVIPIVAFLILPDLGMLPGIGQPHEKRQLPARAVPFYNALHQPVVPAVLLAVVLLAGAGPAWFVAGLAWAAHIAIDRAVGYGLRTPDGWQRG